MISYVVLRDWRGYEKFALEPEPGLTFIVAENGTGKTSLLQAASWALFGAESGVDPSAMLRAGQPQLAVELAAELGDEVLSMRRGWAPASRPRESFVANRDGESLREDDVRTRLVSMAGVPLGVLNRLWFVPELRLVEEPELFGDISGHLRHLLGIDQLEVVAERARRVATAAAKSATQRKQAERLSRDQRLAAEQRAAARETELGAIEETLEELRRRRSALSAELASAAAWRRYEAERLRFMEVQDEVSARLSGLGVTGPIEDAVEDVRGERAAADRDLTAIDTERRLIEGVRQQLAGAGAVCPVCLQSISPEHASRASAIHEDRIEALLAQRGEVEARVRRLIERARQLEALARSVAQRRPPEPPDSESGRSEANVQSELDMIDERIAEANRRHGEAAAELRHVRDSLTADDQLAEREAHIRALYGREAVAKVLSEAARATATDREEKALVPLTEAISRQWRMFFPDRGTPALAGGGTLELRQGDTRLRYGQLSGGERVLASLITRLLFVASSTGLQCIWLDEPLEHLDPVNRIKAARLLAEVTRPGRRIQQIVVTTYEESLARTLASRHDHVRVSYVSTAGLL